MHIADWLVEVEASRAVCYLKRLSANDTQASGSHQAGPYIPKKVMFFLFPTLDRPTHSNPDHCFDMAIDSGAERNERQVRAVWYNNRLRDNPSGGRDEVRITGLGGRDSALLDPESTGSLVVFAFYRSSPDAPINRCRVWVCRSGEDDVVEDRWGPVEPGDWRVVGSRSSMVPPRPEAPCWLEAADLPLPWKAKFPAGAEIVRKSVELRPVEAHAVVDDRLMARRQCEYEMFQSVEEAIELPKITNGFNDLADFLGLAQSIVQRRKARAGRSLELQLCTIFREESLEDDLHFSYQAESEGGKHPDFLFPSARAYNDVGFPASRLRMLAVKTTCKDRWRQILNEADRVQTKHLLTLQEGVSANQFREMKDAAVQLVVPAPLHAKYPADVRDQIVDLGTFLRQLERI